jgi:hypothetical protein
MITETINKLVSHSLNGYMQQWCAKWLVGWYWGTAPKQWSGTRLEEHHTLGVS